MMIGELNETQTKNLLSSQVMGRLACSYKRQPYIVPITFTYDGIDIYGQTHEDEKLKIFRKNPNVCFEVDLITDISSWQSVLVFGEFEEIASSLENKVRAILCNRVFSLRTTNVIHKYGHELTTKIEESNWVKPVFFRIKINKLMGHFQKH